MLNGNHQDEVFLKLKQLLKPFGITHFYTDGLKTYERHIPSEQRTVCKYKMQKIVHKAFNIKNKN